MLKKHARCIATLALTLAFAAPCWTHPEDKEKESPGLKVGARAPAFKLKDQKGKDVALSDLLKKGTVALVFYRSADW